MHLYSGTTTNDCFVRKKSPPKNSVCLFDETLAGETPNSKLLVLESTIVREDINEKNVFSRALPDSPGQPPPMTPIGAILSSIFGRQHLRFKSQLRTKN